VIQTHFCKKLHHATGKCRVGAIHEVPYRLTRDGGKQLEFRKADLTSRSPGLNLAPTRGPIELHLPIAGRKVGMSE
jgi:hypothetical protein